MSGGRVCWPIATRLPGRQQRKGRKRGWLDGADRRVKSEDCSPEIRMNVGRFDEAETEIKNSSEEYLAIRS